MPITLNATDVRNNWSQFNDDVIRNGPRFVKRNRDTWAAISFEHIKEIFSIFTLEAEFIHEEDGTVTATLKGFDFVENGENQKEALDLLIDELVDYAFEYQKNFNLYFNSPNRHAHFPYVMNVLSQDDKEGIKALIQCRVGEK